MSFLILTSLSFSFVSVHTQLTPSFLFVILINASRSPPGGTTGPSYLLKSCARASKIVAICRHSYRHGCRDFSGNTQAINRQCQYGGCVHSYIHTVFNLLSVHALISVHHFFISRIHNYCNLTSVEQLQISPSGVKQLAPLFSCSTLVTK